jgi:hypothetical protein
LHLAPVIETGGARIGMARSILHIFQPARWWVVSLHPADKLLA